MIPGRIILDRYRIIRVIGRGGMGVVVEAEHLALGSRVAIKFLRDDVHSEISPDARFMREARLAARMSSPHSCHVHDYGVWDRGPFLVMELLEGRTLAAELAQRRRLPWPEVVEYIIQACDALGEAHSLGAVHRDIKPSNLFLMQVPGRAPRLKVLDFGGARIPGHSVSKDDEPSLTDASTLIGTPAYISPEQLNDPKRLTSRSDVWSLGVVLYELLAGRQPFRDAWVPKLLVQIAREEPLRLEDLDPELPLGLCELVHRCLSKSPEQRFANAGELGLALTDLTQASDDLLDRLARFATAPTSPARPASVRPVEDDGVTVFDHRFDSLDPHTTTTIHIGRRRTRRLATSLVAAIVTAAVLGVFWLGRTTGWRAAASTARATAGSVAAPVVDDDVELAFVAAPGAARFYLDGQPLPSNPFQGTRRRDARTHDLRIEAQGHKTQTLVVRFTHPVVLTVSLEGLVPSPLPEATAGPAAVVPAAGSPQPAQPRRAATPREGFGNVPLDRTNPYGQ